MSVRPCDRCGEPIPASEPTYARYCSMEHAMAALQEREAAEREQRRCEAPEPARPDRTLDPLIADVESCVLGAILVGGALGVDTGHKVLDGVLETGLEPADFYRRSQGRLYQLMLEERQAGRPLDALSLTHAIDGTDPQVRGRLEALAHTCPAMSPAPHWARLVAQAARERKAVA